MFVVVNHIKTDKDSGVLIYRRKFPKDLIPFVPGKSPNGRGRAEFKKSLRTKSMTAPGAAARLQEAQDAFDALVRLAERQRTASTKRATGAFDVLDQPTIAYLAECYRVNALASDDARRKDPSAKAFAARISDMIREEGHEFPVVSASAKWTQVIRLAHSTMREAARELRVLIAAEN